MLRWVEAMARHGGGKGGHSDLWFGLLSLVVWPTYDGGILYLRKDQFYGLP